MLIGSKGHEASATAPKRPEPARPPAVAVMDVEKKPRGRPNLKEAKKQARKLQMSELDAFIESKPTKNKVREYFEMRVRELKDQD